MSARSVISMVMVPSHEGLGADDAFHIQVDDRLEPRHQLVSVDGALQTLADQQSVGGGNSMMWFVYDDMASAVGFRLVHRGVCLPK